MERNQTPYPSVSCKKTSLPAYVSNISTLSLGSHVCTLCTWLTGSVCTESKTCWWRGENCYLLQACYEARSRDTWVDPVVALEHECCTEIDRRRLFSSVFPTLR